MQNRILVGVLAALLLVGMISLAVYDYKPNDGKSASSSPHGGMGDDVDPLKGMKFPEVIAVVNGTEIQRNKFIGALRGNIEMMKMQGQQLTPEILEKVKSDIIEHLVGSEIFYQEAVAQNIEISNEKLNSEYERIVKRYEADEEFKKRLNDQEITLDNLKHELEKGYMITLLLEKEISPKVKVEEMEAMKYYQENVAMFKSPETIRARHILLKLEPDAPKEEVEKAEKEMQEIVAEVKKTKNFTEVAKKRSQGPSAPEGGDLGFFPRGAMVKEFEDAAFSLRPGQPGKVVRTRFGLHYIETVEMKPASVVPFAEMKSKIMSQLQMIERGKKVQEFLTELKDKAEIKMFQ